VRQIAVRTTRIRELESELAALVQGYAPQLWPSVAVAR
jgi:hypothetical protein